MASTPAPSHFAPLVLVVDDDDDARAVARGMLHVIGYRTRAASNGDEAMGALHAERPAAILLDLHMPGLDGFGFLDQAAQRVPEFERIPVFVASGVYRDASQVQRALLRRRVWAFLQKPFSISALREGMRDFLDLVPPHPGNRDRERPPADLGPAPPGVVVMLSSPGLPAKTIAEVNRLAAARGTGPASPAPSASSATKLAPLPLHVAGPATSPSAQTTAAPGPATGPSAQTTAAPGPATGPSAQTTAARGAPSGVHTRAYRCEFSAALLCAGTVVPCVVLECGPQSLDVHRNDGAIGIGERVILRAQVESDDGRASFDLRLRALAAEARGPAQDRVTTLRLEEGSVDGDYSGLLDWLAAAASRGGVPTRDAATAPTGDAG